jgi:hypothetical protein
MFIVYPEIAATSKHIPPGRWLCHMLIKTARAVRDNRTPKITQYISSDTRTVDIVSVETL